MGMSAGQARLLSITAKLTDNELRSQILTNSKLRLADKSSEASEKYMNALNTQKLVYTNYDGAGNNVSQALTAGTLLSFGDMKNQYAMVNSSGQILVSANDIDNFTRSRTLTEFLDCYGVSKITNPEHTNQLEKIYGRSYADFYDENDIYGIYEDKIINQDGLRGLINNFVDYDNNSGEYIVSSHFLSTADTNGDGINELIVSPDYSSHTSELQNYINTLGYDKLTNDSVYKTLLNSAVDLIASVPSLTPPQKAAYPAEPLQSQYQKEYVDELYTNTFLSAFNQYPGLYDETTETFNVNMTADYPYIQMGFEDVLALLMTDDYGSLFTSFNSDGVYEPMSSEDKYFNESVTFWEPEHWAGWQGAYGADFSQSGIQYSNFEELRNQIWAGTVDGYNLTELQQALVDAYYFACVVSSESTLHDPSHTLKIEKDEADRMHDQEVFEQAEAYYLEAKENVDSGAWGSSANDEYERAYAVYYRAKDELTKDYYEIDPDNANWFNAPMNSFASDYENPNISYLYNKFLDNVIKQIKLNGNPEMVDDVEAYDAAYAEYEQKKQQIDEQYLEDIQEYNAKLDTAVQNFEQTLINNYKNYINNENNYKIELDNILNNSVLIPDKSDSKYQWYTNLWYRMGGLSESEKQENGKCYKELDSSLMNNSEWIQFALEHGMITLEQAKFNENGSDKYPGMGTYDWSSIIYSSASDIVSQEDQVAIAKAEVEYENTVREIQNEDKKLDQDLKKLDTQHSALQTEYESIKSVIDKNVERSFKAFS